MASSTNGTRTVRSCRFFRCEGSRSWRRAPARRHSQPHHSPAQRLQALAARWPRAETARRPQARVARQPWARSPQHRFAPARQSMLPAPPQPLPVSTLSCLPPLPTVTPRRKTTQRRKAFPSHMWHSRAPSVKMVGAKFRRSISRIQPRAAGSNPKRFHASRCSGADSVPMNLAAAPRLVLPVMTPAA
jgi:hypothetical protein